MSNALKDGLELSVVITAPDADGDRSVWVTEQNHPAQFECKRIVVEHLNGPMAAMPWARCERMDGYVDMVNLFQAESFQLAKRTEGQS